MNIFVFIKISRGSVLFKNVNIIFCTVILAAADLERARIVLSIIVANLFLSIHCFGPFNTRMSRTRKGLPLDV